MKSTSRRFVLALSLAATALTTNLLHAKDPAITGMAPIKLTVSASVENDKRMPDIQKEEIFVKNGKERLAVTEWVAARGDNAGLELFILIDDASSTSLGSQLGDLAKFVNAQPSTTSIGVGYARNGTVQIAQNLTPDHAQAAKALRLPFGSAGAFGSPYLSVVDLMKRWPESPNRREVLLVTDGIDRAGRGRNALLNPDVDTAADLAQRMGTILHTLYFPGVGHWHRNFWDANNGQNGLAKLSDATGGESYFLGLQAPVSFSPYLDQLQRTLDNQYLLKFSIKPDKRAGWKSISINTEIPGVDLNTANAVWAPAAK